MYIVAIAWLYVVLMMSITERSPIAGVMTFLLYGVFPLTIVLYLMGTPQRKRNRQMAKKNEVSAAQAARDADAGPADAPPAP
jgi:biotin transporter BioY